MLSGQTIDNQKIKILLFFEESNQDNENLFKMKFGTNIYKNL